MYFFFIERRGIIPIKIETENTWKKKLLKKKLLKN